MSRTKGELEIDGRTLTVSNLDKVLYPKTGFTKADVIDYYIGIASAILPHLRHHALTLKRYPEGVDAPFFYEKNAPAHRPPWVVTVPVSSPHKVIHYTLVNDLPTLIWAANLATLELHVSLASAPNIDRPDALVFDLDPGPPADLLDCCRVALLLRALLKEDRLEAYPKTSGSKGLQLYIPLNTPVTFQQTKAYAKKIAETLENAAPDLVLSKMSKPLRKGKIFIDWSQNDPHKTTICAYSLRALEFPSVSTPLTWQEIEAAFKNRSSTQLRFTPAGVLNRVKEYGDLFAPLCERRQYIPTQGLAL